MTVLAQIHHLDFRKLPFFNAIFKGKLDKILSFDIVIGLNRRGGRAEKRNSLLKFCPYHGQISGIVPEVVFLFIGGVVLLVDDDQTEI